MLTTKDIIKILPFDMEFKTQLYLNYDRLSDSQKCDVMDIIWNAYDAYYQLKLQWNLQVAAEKNLKGESKDMEDPDFFRNIAIQTEKEITEESGKETNEFDIVATRTALEDVMKKIRESQ
jgi:hypothetical protein